MNSQETIQKDGLWGVKGCHLIICLSLQFSYVWCFFRFMAVMCMRMCFLHVMLFVYWGLRVVWLDPVPGGHDHEKHWQLFSPQSRDSLNIYTYHCYDYYHYHHVYISIYTCMYIYIYIYTYIHRERERCACVYIYIYIYIYIHTYTHTSHLSRAIRELTRPSSVLQTLPPYRTVPHCSVEQLSVAQHTIPQHTILSHIVESYHIASQQSYDAHIIIPYRKRNLSYCFTLFATNAKTYEIYNPAEIM